MLHNNNMKNIENNITKILQNYGITGSRRRRSYTESFLDRLPRDCKPR